MKRAPGNCPYRILSDDPAGDGAELATCDLLARLTGIAIDDPILRVTQGNCTYCCNEPVVASPATLNPGVGSYLFNLTCEIIQAGGHAGCSVEKAQELQQLAIKHLRQGETPPQPSRHPKFNRPCLCLGDPVGDENDGTFICRHEFRPQTTTEAKCKGCKVYDPVLEPAPCVTDWAVGLTTAPRRQATLATTLESLAEAGWTNPTIFAEPRSRIPKTCQHLKIVRRQETLGAWPNFVLGLNELHLCQPDAHAYLMVQDDALFLNHTREYLEATLWPHSHTGVVSLHTPSHHVPDDQETSGFFPRKVGWGAWGAMAFVFPNAAVRALLCHPEVINHRSRGTGEGTRNVDSVVGHWCHIAGWEFYLHRPSLTQHIGLTTTLWKKDSLAGRRSASDFPGEDFDARDFIPRATSSRAPSQDPDPSARTGT